MSLQEQLSRGAEAWLEAEVLPPDRSAMLTSLVRRRAWRRRLVRGVWGAAAAASVAGMVIVWPVVISVASGFPVVGPIVARWAKSDRGAEWAAQNGYVVPVDKAVSDQGYTFRIESVVADAAQTVIYYQVEGPGLSDATLPPIMHFTFNRKPFNGAGSQESAVVDGRLIGKETLPPLPYPVALLGITVQEIAGVRGSWQVSFMASRTELDRLTRAVNATGRPEPLPVAVPGTEERLPTLEEIAKQVSTPPVPADASQGETSSLPPPAVQPVAEAPRPADEDPAAELAEETPGPGRTVAVGTTWTGKGYRLTIERIIITPTATVIEAKGSVPGPAEFDIRYEELTADGKQVPFKSGSYRSGDGYFRFVFDRLEGEPAALTFRLPKVVKWLPGGPVIDLTKPGVQVTYGLFTFELESVQTENGKTTVITRTLSTERRMPGERVIDFKGWTVVDAEGRSYRSVNGHGYWGEDGIWRESFTFETGAATPLRLEARLHPEPLPGPFEVTIPLK